MKKTFIVFLLLLGVVSCEKDKQVIVENNNIPLISRKLADGELFSEYIYNDANLLTAEMTKFHYTKYNYDDQNQLTSAEFYVDVDIFSSDSRALESSMMRKQWVNPANTEKSLTIKFEYNDAGRLTKAVYMRPGVINSEYTEFAWTDDRITRKTMYWNLQVSGYTDYFYDDRGNLAKEAKYRIEGGDAKLITSTGYEYDKMNNPFRSFKRLITPGIFTNRNNITSETYTLYSDVQPGTENPRV
ncbi:MAG: hypothetical protein WCE64_06005, partial [Bacteroidales bacterium]